MVLASEFNIEAIEYEYNLLSCSKTLNPKPQCRLLHYENVSLPCDPTSLLCDAQTARNPIPRVLGLGFGIPLLLPSQVHAAANEPKIGVSKRWGPAHVPSYSRSLLKRTLKRGPKVRERL